tara:strand:+ start:4703 stop:5110 length:408 start_codon:yes stop_codon:yes gene_type:complete
MTDNDLDLGKIAYVSNLPDPQGENAKNRRCVVIKRVHKGEHYLLVATTSKFDRENISPFEERFRAGNPQQPSRLGFTEPTVAKCDWLAIVREEDCDFTGRKVNPVQLGSLIAKTEKAIISGQHTVVRNDVEKDEE